MRDSADRLVVVLALINILLLVLGLSLNMLPDTQIGTKKWGPDRWLDSFASRQPDHHHPGPV